MSNFTVSIEVVVKKKEPEVSRIADIEVRRAIHRFGQDVEINVGPPGIAKEDRELLRLVKNMQDRGVTVDSFSLIKEAGEVERSSLLGRLLDLGLLKSDEHGVFNLTEKGAAEALGDNKDAVMVIQIDVKKDDQKLFREVAERVRSALHRIEDDVIINEKPIFKLSHEEKTVLTAVHSLEGRNERPDVYRIIEFAGIGGLKAGMSIQSLLELKLIEEDEKGIFKVTELGNGQVAKIMEERKKISH